MATETGTFIQQLFFPNSRIREKRMNEGPERIPNRLPRYNANNNSILCSSI